MRFTCRIETHGTQFGTETADPIPKMLQLRMPPIEKPQVFVSQPFCTRPFEPGLEMDSRPGGSGGKSPQDSCLTLLYVIWAIFRKICLKCRRFLKRDVLLKIPDRREIRA
jgi:hypothetical protein